MEPKPKRTKVTRDSEITRVLQQLRGSLSQFNNVSGGDLTTQEYLMLSEIGDTLKELERKRKSLIIYQFNWPVLLQTNVQIWVDLLPCKDVLSLALCNSSIFSNLSPTISAHFSFYQQKKSQIFKKYAPVILREVNHTRNIPKSVQRMYFTEDAQVLISQLPPQVTHLHFEDKDIKIPALPETLTSLYLYCYKLHSSLVLPSSLTELTIIVEKNAPVLSSLHNLKSLTVITPRHGSAQSIGDLPSSLETLKYNCYGPAHTIASFPPLLKYLKIEHCKVSAPLPPLLVKLKLLTLSGQKFVFPPALRDLHLSSQFNELVFVSDNLAHLKLGHNFNQPVDNLPKFLSHLSLDGMFNQRIDALPPSLTKLHFESQSEFNQPVDHLPATLTHLTFGIAFNHPVNHLPPALTHLSFGDNFEQPLQNLPTSLQFLHIGSAFNHPLCALPALVRLSFSYNAKFNHPLPSSPFLSQLHYGTTSSYTRSEIERMCAYYKTTEIHSFPHLTYFSYSSLKNKDLKKLYNFSEKTKRIALEIVDDEGNILVKVIVNFETWQVYFEHYKVKKDSDDDEDGLDEDSEDD